MQALNKIGHKFQSVTKLWGVALITTVLLAACGGGGSSDPASPTSTAVTLTGQVYDQGIANADVTIYVGDQAVASTTTDLDGNYSVTLQITEQARASRCVVVATRDVISLRSLLGNVGAITDTATANNGTVTSELLPYANVTNVSTAIAAVIEASGGALPDSQAAIDAAVAAIATDATLQDKVVKIAAAIKAVVDYGGDPSVIGAATNTEELAAALAVSVNLSADLDTVVATSSATSANQLVLEVEGDPTLAAQIPSDGATLVAGLVGNTYVTNNSLGEETLLYFQSGGAVTIADYSDIEQGGLPGTYTDNLDGTFTINMTETVDGVVGGITVVLTVTGGSANAISTNVVVTDSIGTVNEGLHVLRRIIPVVAGASSATQIGVADLIDTHFINIDSSTALKINATCDGTADDARLRSAAGSLRATCDTALGMLVFTPAANTVGLEKSMAGLMADSWDGSAISQRMNVAIWEADANLGSIASYGRVYQPIDSNIPNPIVLRIYPDFGDGNIGAQLRFISVVDTAGDTKAEGKQDNYNFSQAGISAKTKDHIEGTTHPKTGSLIVNGSIGEGIVDNSTIFWADSTDGSVSISINLGSNANAGLGAVLKPYTPYGMAVRTRYIYDLSEIVAADVSGKTFTFTDIVFPESGTVTFNADGTASFTDSFGQESFNWTIDKAIPGNVITSGVADHGTTLVLIFADGSKEYHFAQKSGDAIILGGYKLDNNRAYISGTAGILTPQ